MDPAMLRGYTVIDLSSVGPASRCSRILADYGARVIKVGPTARKASVQIEPAYWSYGAGRGMQRVRIDLKAPEGRDAFLRLSASADVVIESFRPGVADRIGIGYADVKRSNERIVYCSTSGYGQDGPYAQWAGHDVNYLALAGFLHCSGRRADGSPALPGATVADSAAGGMHASIAILAALLRRGATGAGAYLDVSVAEGVLSLMSLHIDEHLATRNEPGPGSNILTGRYACYDVYRARDGKWLAVGAIEPAFFANLCKALGLEPWIPHQLDDARQDEIRAALREAFARRDRDAWVAELAPASTCVAPVRAITELADDPHFAARGILAEARHEEHGSFRQLGAVLAGGDRAQPAHRVPPRSATDTDGVLRGVGMTDPEIEQLRGAGVVE
ncbi:MAG: CoA transferase [Deltaproteobacteria bacterium]|nr:MAG: CoA transferase [Deltaproteobacteria bacterium]